MKNYPMKLFGAFEKAEEGIGHGNRIEDDDNLLRMGKRPVLKVGMRG